MADSKVSALTAATALTANDEVYVNDGGTSKRITAANLAKTLVTGQTAKTTPVAADELLISDTEASNAAKKVTIAQLQSALTVASDSATGVVELATAAEVTTGTDAARVPSVAVMGSHKSVASIWARLKGTDTFALVDDYGVASATDNGTGDYTITFDASLANANYAVAGTVKADGFLRVKDTGEAVDSLRVEVLLMNTGGTNTDADSVGIVIFGGK